MIASLILVNFYFRQFKKLPYKFLKELIFICINLQFPNYSAHHLKTLNGKLLHHL